MSATRPDSRFRTAVAWLLPPRRNRLTTFSWLEVLLVLFLMFLFWPAMAQTFVVGGGIGAAVHGEDVVRAAIEDKEASGDMARARLGMLSTLVALPFQVLTAPLVFLRISGSPPYQIGLTTHRPGRNVLLGAIAFVLVTPTVLTAHFWLNEIVTHLLPDTARPHPFEIMIREGSLSDVEIGLVVFLAVVAAPLVEEILFRGVLLTALSRNEIASSIVACLSVLRALLTVEPANVLAGNLASLIPGLCACAMLVGHGAIVARQLTPVPSALYSSSMLFGMVHVFAWPSPLPLFVLALALGWLRLRTGSLVGPVVLHALFNGVACVQLVSLT